MQRRFVLGSVAGLSVLLLTGCASWRTPRLPSRGGYAVDSGGRPVRELQAGSSLLTGARGLEPRRTYEVRLGHDGPARSAAEAVSFARLTTDARGEIRPFVLWYQAGVVGCSPRIGHETRPRPHTYRTFEEAERALRGRTLTVSVHPVDTDPTGRTNPLELRAGEAVSVTRMPVTPRSSPMVYASNADGCLLNSSLTQGSDLYVTGRNFKPGETVEVSVAPNQRAWRVGDMVGDVTGATGNAAPERVQADGSGSFRIKVWDQAAQRRGVYDVVATRNPVEGGRRSIGLQDVVSYGVDTGVVLFLHYPIGGPTMDLAGRPIPGSPYFQFADSFADQNDTVWGAVDPTYVPAIHPGGSYAAYYVVAHRDVNGWDPLSGGATNLTDLSGGIEIMPVKAGCVNGTDVPIWNPPLTLGQYDVVVDFGASPAETQPDFVTDANYNSATDFLDGSDQIGFVVAKDPHELGTIPVGRTTYSVDDFFPTLGTASNVDLRAVVRYPATADGDDTQVATGQHPIFVIEHGNHALCEMCKDGGGNPVPCDSILIMSCNQLYNHATCPSRVPNHEGYMRLLDILASHGVIAVSIDAYDLTGANCFVQGWIEERGQLILKHLELWSHLNDASTFPTYPDPFAGKFQNHVDFSKVSVSGHSRGGEASVSAFVQNTGFNIVGVSSVAPVDFEGYTLPDVPYFVILPAADGDVSNLSGQPIYDRAGGAADDTTKSTIYVYGANHNFFNTVWADDGDDSPVPRDDFIPKADQQRLGEAYLAAFTLSHLKNETVYEDMLRGKMIFPSTAGLKVFHSRHEKQHSRKESGSGAGATASGATKVPVNGPSVHSSQALQVGWAAAAHQLTYTLPGLQDASTFEVLSFRVAQTWNAVNPAAGQDFQVELVGGGSTKGTYSSRFAPIPPPYDHPYGLNHAVMTTVRIPLHSFIMNNSGVTLDQIDTIRFKFSNPGQGEIYVDDVEFSR